MGPVEVDHVQVSISEGVLRLGRRDSLNAGVLRVVVWLSSPGGRLLPLRQVQVCVCDVIVVLDLNEAERRSFWSPSLSPTLGTKSGCFCLLLASTGSALIHTQFFFDQRYLPPALSFQSTFLLTQPEGSS